MPKVIAILNQKGGVGKTTLAVHLATALARNRRRVLLVDADPQGSALDWAAARTTPPLFPVVGLPKNSIHKELPALAVNYDFVIIDGPPRVYEVLQVRCRCQRPGTGASAAFALRRVGRQGNH